MREYISDFIGKPLCTEQGECIGYIKNVQVNRTFSRIRNIEWCDTDEEEHLLPCCALRSCGTDAAVVRRTEQNPIANCISVPFGKQILSADGTSLGYVCDFARNGMQILSLITRERTEIPTDTVTAANDVLFIGKSRKRPTKPKAVSDVSKLKNTSISDVSELKDTSISDDSELKDTSISDDSELKDEPTDTTVSEKPPKDETLHEFCEDVSPILPQKAKRCIGSTLLTGKVLPSDIRDVHGIVLAKAGTTVTAELIRRCIQHEKLFELTLLCCQNPLLRR